MFQLTRPSPTNSAPLLGRQDPSLETIPQKTTKFTKTSWLILFFVALTCLGDNTIDFELDVLHYKEFPLLTMIIMVIFPVIGRILIDVLGLQCAIAIFASIPVITQILFGFPKASWIASFLCHDFRLHRIAQSCLWVGRTTMITKWFRNKTLSLALAIILSLSRLRDIFYESHSDSPQQNPGQINPVRLGICLFSFVAALLLVFIDKKASERRLRLLKDPREPQRFCLKDLQSFPLIYYLTVSVICVHSFPVSINLRYDGSRQHVSWWFYVIFVLVGLPFVGFMTDRLGKRIHGILANFIVIFTLGSVLLIQFGFSKDKGILGLMAPISVASYLFEVISWPCVGLVVEQKLTGTAYAIGNSLKNLVLFVVLGVIEWSEGDWICWMVLSSALGMIGVGCIAGLYIEDKKKGDVLNKPAYKEKIRRIFV